MAAGDEMGRQLVTPSARANFAIVPLIGGLRLVQVASGKGDARGVRSGARVPRQRDPPEACQPPATAHGECYPKILLELGALPLTE
jgi:hypothetical protein